MEEKTSEQTEEPLLKREPVEDRIARMTKTGLMREAVLTLRKIWQSLELLAFLGAAAMLIWGGTKITNIHGFADILEAVIIAISALLFARIGWSMPESRFKKAIERYTQIK